MSWCYTKKVQCPDISCFECTPNEINKDIKKEHDENEFWTYDNSFKNVIPVYFVDGQIRGSEHATAQYLIDTYKMELSEAYKYVNEIGRNH